MKNTESQLSDYVEGIKQEAYQAGYRTAMEAVAGFVKQPPQTPTRATRTAKAPVVKSTRSPRRQGRGDNAAVVAEALKSLPERTGRAGDIRKVLATGGRDLAYTSIRHALGQLQGQDKATLASDNKTWTLSATD